MTEFSKDVKTGKSLLQLIRYGLIGIGSNLAIYLLYLLVTHLGLDPKSAMTVLYISGATVVFFVNRTWTFAHTGALIQAGAKYALMHFFGYLLNLFILFTFVDRLGFPHQVVQAVAIILVAGILFVAFKYFVFAKRESCTRGRE